MTFPLSHLSKALGAALSAYALLSAAPVYAQQPLLAQRFDSVLAQHGVVGGGFAVIRPHQPVLMHFYGVAREGKLLPIDAQSTYNWASITKTMTAIAIMQLRDRGMLSLDDSAVSYVPELRQVHSKFGSMAAVTIRELLNHSAGFRNPTWPWDCEDAVNCEWQPFEPTQWSQVVAMLPYTQLAFQPGSRWSYSNLGYVFLGQIIQRLSGEDYEIYVQKNILMPLDMHDSYFDRSPYYLTGHVSASYVRAGAVLTEQPFDFDTGITAANSGLKAPLPDMVKYLHFLLGDTDDPRYAFVLKRASLKEMWMGSQDVMEPGKPETPYTRGMPKMGLGFFVDDHHGQRYVFHDGDQGGFSSELMLDMTDHAASILVVNTTDTGAPAPATSSHAVSNTEPAPGTDLRLTLRQALQKELLPPR